MVIPSAQSKRMDQKFMSLPEYRELDCLKQLRASLKTQAEETLFKFQTIAGDKALKRLKAQAKREGISPLEKLCRLERLSLKK